jgi:hypothetical protein
MSTPVIKVCCPACGKTEGVWISYGHTGGTPRQPDHVYGGCNMSDGRPARACLSCGHSWGMLMTERHPDGKMTKRWVDDPERIAELLLDPHYVAAVEREKDQRERNAANWERLQKVIEANRLSGGNSTS